jgi:hypothetical protein
MAFRCEVAGEAGAQPCGELRLAFAPFHVRPDMLTEYAAEACAR